ncbi:MAG: replication-associated recombination protein A, partial [Deltaproteobacteria bacterium]|nr:replication-associated recombination protein A [Deltaproteobacteria bacterium]
ALAQVAVYLATAEKSNSIYSAYDAALADAREKGALPVPLHIRNAPTRLMKDLGYGRGYRYAHDFEDAIVSQEHMPDQLKGKRYYFPTNRGREKAVAEKLANWRRSLDGNKNRDSQIRTNSPVKGLKKDEGK